jgi:uncharacterized membrane protein YfcA
LWDISITKRLDAFGSSSLVTGMSIRALPALLWFVLASVITAPLGAKATHHMKIGVLRKLFALLLLVLAIKLLLKVLA